ncbi:ABC transporter [Hirsutella rhossiliensis]|uniref:ABC transporter domain-containing protein n=1 Tax=Hirsutella rhossiliensis TaxID=111463 RepID=A0A9P8SKD9_9HYPO|nr:ABC transporter domain-containing protein [Hirsutella rhossiliensis]KAH0965821.1 ABC transporter domain-containing protein [Hirsutella rhossiliensis]
MLGLVDSWTRGVQALRVAELQRSKTFRTFIAYMNVLGNTPSALAPILTFGVAIAMSGNAARQKLSLATSFTSLSIISLISAPLAHLIASVPSFFSCLGSFERIELFVDEGEYRPEASQEDAAEPDDGAIQLSTWRSGQTPVVEADNVTCSVKDGQEPLLRNLSFTIAPSTLTVVTGKVGSGKSMLLLAILGELHTDGRLNRTTKGTAYCSQVPWLVNASIQQNIVGPADEDIDQAWYSAVVRACALDHDFQQLQDGDGSLIGSKGLTLSGGQRHRVALARAIYAKRSILVADDVFAGLDAQTKSHVWTHVFGPSGLLRRHQTTVLLATHTLDFLQDAQHIIILDNGRISSQGSIDELGDSLSQLIHQETNQKPSSSVTSSSSSEIKLGTSVKPAAKAEAEDVEDLSRRTGDLSLYLYYFRSIGWNGSSTFHLPLTPKAEIWLKWWTEANDGHAEASAWAYYGVYVTLLCVWVAFVGINCWFMFVVVIPKSAEWLHWKLLETTMKAPMAFFSYVDTGDLVNRFSQDMSLVDRELPTAAYMSLAGLLSCVGEAILIILGSKYLAATLPLAILLLYLLQRFYLCTSRQLRVLDLQAKAPLYTQLLEMIEGLATIRAFGWQPRWLTLVLDLLVDAAAVLLMFFGVLAGSSIPGNMAIAMYSALGFSESLANLLSSWTSLETSLGAISRLKEFTKATSQEAEPSLGIHATVELPASWPRLGHLQWQNIEAGYATPKGKEAVLHGLSLDIRPGQKIAICGRTGSGKSSLISTLFGLINYEGTILIDGVDISRIPNQALRQGLIVIPQNPVLFPGSLRSNLLPRTHFPSEQIITDDNMIALLQRLQVWTAIRQSGSLDTEVEHLALSHGQMQLLCLARAILRKHESSVLIMDEAMSGVDYETEKVMLEALSTEFSGHTVVSVVHRLNTIHGFNKLVVLDRGSIVQIEAPGEMLTYGRLKCPV